VTERVEKLYKALERADTTIKKKNDQRGIIDQINVGAKIGIKGGGRRENNQIGEISR